MPLLTEMYVKCSPLSLLFPSYTETILRLKIRNSSISCMTIWSRENGNCACADDVTEEVNLTEAFPQLIIAACCMAPKIYLHFDGPPQYTKLIKLGPNSSTKPTELLSIFAEAYKRKFPHAEPLNQSQLALKSTRGIDLTLKAALQISEGGESDYLVSYKPQSLR